MIDLANYDAADSASEDQIALMQKIALSNQTILAQLERLTNALKQ